MEETNIPITDTITVEQLRQRLNISRTLVYQAIRRKEIPSIKIGRRILIPTNYLQRMLSK